MSELLSKKFCSGNFDSVTCLTSVVLVPMMAVLAIPIFISFKRSRRTLAFSFIAAIIGIAIGCYLFLITGQGI